jgi:hypothetical protein
MSTLNYYYHGILEQHFTVPVEPMERMGESRYYRPNSCHWVVQTGFAPRQRCASFLVPSRYWFGAVDVAKRRARL